MIVNIAQELIVIVVMIMRVGGVIVRRLVFFFVFLKVMAGTVLYGTTGFRTYLKISTLTPLTNLCYIFLLKFKSHGITDTLTTSAGSLIGYLNDFLRPNRRTVFA